MIGKERFADLFYKIPLVHWLTLTWWRYLLKPSENPLRAFICRVRKHPYGVVFFNLNPYKLEPDTTCKNCGDDLG